MTSYQQLVHWVERSLPERCELAKPIELTPVSGDAGFRSYFRLNTSPSLVAVNAPPTHENNEAFVQVADLLRAHGVRSPVVHAVDYQQGFLLLEDLGSKLLLPQLTEATVHPLYERAEQALLSVQRIPVTHLDLPRYHHQRLMDEMELFPEWFVGRLLGLALSLDEREQLQRWLRLLADTALQQPVSVVHRDFHSRNLMLLDSADSDPQLGEAGEPATVGVIDFQDAVVGPITYDLVSLLRDCYVRWPPSLVEARALAYRDKLVAAGVCHAVSDTQFMRWFNWMGLQRHLKVLGIFARLSLRDDKPQYLNDLPLVLRYVLEQLGGDSELAPFKDWFEQRLLSDIEQQPWYQPWQQAGESVQ